MLNFNTTAKKTAAAPKKSQYLILDYFLACEIGTQNTNFKRK